MNTLQKLEALISQFHTVNVLANEHRDNYQTLPEWFDERDQLQQTDESAEVRAACISHNSVVRVQVYPATPIGFCDYIGHDLQTAVEAAYTALIHGGR